MGAFDRISEVDKGSGPATRRADRTAPVDAKPRPAKSHEREDLARSEAERARGIDAARDRIEQIRSEVTETGERAPIMPEVTVDDAVQRVLDASASVSTGTPDHDGDDPFAPSNRKVDREAEQAAAQFDDALESAATTAAAGASAGAADAPTSVAPAIPSTDVGARVREAATGSTKGATESAVAGRDDRQRRDSDDANDVSLATGAGRLREAVTDSAVYGDDGAGGIHATEQDDALRDLRSTIRLEGSGSERYDDRDDERAATEEELDGVGDDASLSNVDLQNVMQDQQELLQRFSNVAKAMHDLHTDAIEDVEG